MAWPVAPEACAHPFESVTWLAAMQVVTSRCGGQPEKLAAIGLAEFTVLVRQAVAGWGGQRPAGPVCRAVFAALASTEGWWYRTGGGCCGGAPMSWVTCSVPAPSCGPWRLTWPPCWASSACPGWRTSPG